jgi:two-component system response regulator MprA
MCASPTTPLLLIVDDDVQSARALAQLLREDGYSVEVAHDGAAAIGRLTRDPPPQLIATDLRLPRASGLEVIRFARQRHPAMPIVVVTGYPELVADMKDTFPVFGKPLAYVDFTRAVVSLLEKSSSLR